MTIGINHNVAGSGYWESMRQQYIMGWQGKWKSSDNEPNWVAARVNPILVCGCGDKAALADAAAKYGEVKEVFVPEGQTFAYVHFKDNDSAPAAIEGLKDVGGVPVKVQPGKQANAEVAAWKASLRAKAKV